MTPAKVILIFDVGKTNKKILLFNEVYQLVYETSTPFEEITDEDGFPCEDVQKLTKWILDSFKIILSKKEFSVEAVNFSGYGASLVFTDEDLNPVLPLYNYLKTYPPALLEEFYNTYDGKEEFSKTTASPPLGSLNSGLQIYRIKKEKPEAFEAAEYILHLPQYISSVITKIGVADKTSVGCHTGLWNFAENSYHRWLIAEDAAKKMAPILLSEACFPQKIAGRIISVGIGLHDTSAALIPYTGQFKHPFVLISTGTWCVSLNPFNRTPLTTGELEKDCLCYFDHMGRPVKASRIFAGYHHEQMTKAMAKFFGVSADYFTKTTYDPNLIQKLVPDSKKYQAVGRIDLSVFSSPEEAYHSLMIQIIDQQKDAVNLVIGKQTGQIFVEGGFSKNELYMNLLTAAFPDREIYAASMSQASALGAALVIHNAWNEIPLANDIITLKRYRKV